MSDFASFLHAIGLLPKDVVPDGRWHRCPTADKPRAKNGSFKLAVDGLIGWAMDFAVHTEPLTWRPDKEYVAPRIDGAAIARKRAAERKALLEATRAAQKFYLECRPLRGGHPYLVDHGLTMTGCFGLKLDREGWLVIPVLLDGALISVQRISPAGEKRFWYGASVKGGSYPIERAGASLTVLCEGFATGAAIFAAAPLTRVVVCFNAGNLGEVPQPRRGMVVVAADNDHATEKRIGRNPGLEAARAAADALGCGVAVPMGIIGTDWSDYMRERLAALLENCGRRRESDIRRAVDAEIAAAMMRHARFMRSMKAA